MIFVSHPKFVDERRLQELLRPYHLSGETYAAADRDEVQEWIAAHVAPDGTKDAYILMSDLTSKIKKTITAAQWKKIGSARFKEKAVNFMADGEHCESGIYGGNKLTNFIKGYTLIM